MSIRDATVKAVQGFGDAAYRMRREEAGIVSDGIAVRKANVVIILTYIGPSPYATAVTADDELIRDALRRIRLS